MQYLSFCKNTDTRLFRWRFCDDLFKVSSGHYHPANLEDYSIMQARFAVTERALF